MSTVSTLALAFGLALMAFGALHIWGGGIRRMREGEEWPR